MALLDEVNTAIAASMKAKDQARLSTLRMLKAALVSRSVHEGRALSDEEALQVVGSLVKQRRESIEHFEKAGRADLVNKETLEIGVLESYLPAAAGPEEIEQAIDAAIAETGAVSARDLGRVMKAALGRLAGRGVDGKVVNEIVRRRLGG